MPFTGLKTYFNRLLLADIEGTSGVAETLTGTDIVYCEDGLQIVANPTTQQRRELGVGIDQGIPLVTSNPGSLTAPVALRGSGAAGTAPNFGPLMQASRMSETISAGVSVTYAPVSTAAETITAILYEDGKRTDLVGVAVGWSIAMSTDGIPTITFTGAGTFDDPAQQDEANPSIASPPTQPVAWVGDRGGVITLDASPYIISSLTFDYGATPTPVADANSNGGIFAHLITDRAIVGTINPASVPVATNDFFSNLVDGTELALVAVLGETAGNIMTVNADIVITGFSPTNDNGIERLDTNFAVVPGTFSMVWT